MLDLRYRTCSIVGGLGREGTSEGRWLWRGFVEFGGCCGVIRMNS